MSHAVLLTHMLLAASSTNIPIMPDTVKYKLLPAKGKAPAPIPTTSSVERKTTTTLDRDDVPKRQPYVTKPGKTVADVPKNVSVGRDDDDSDHKLKLKSKREQDGSGDLDPTDYSGDRVVINRIISEKCAELAIDLSALDFSRWKSRGENVERKLSVAENIRSSAFIERGSRVMRDCFARFRCLTCRAVWGSAKAECSIIHWNVTENGRLNLPTVETIFTQTCKRRGCDQRPTEPQFNLGTFSRRIDIALRIGAAMPLPPLAHVNEEKKKDPHKFMLCGYCYPKYVRGTSLIGGLHRLQMIEAGDL